LSKVVTTLIKITRKGDSLITFFFGGLQYHLMYTFYHVPTQAIKPMLHGHVLDFEKAKHILERLIIHVSHNPSCWQHTMIHFFNAHHSYNSRLCSLPSWVCCFGLLITNMLVQKSSLATNYFSLLSMDVHTLHCA
jgi:hypothetical protein